MNLRTSPCTSGELAKAMDRLAGMFDSMVVFQQQMAGIQEGNKKAQDHLGEKIDTLTQTVAQGKSDTDKKFQELELKCDKALNEVASLKNDNGGDDGAASSHANKRLKASDPVGNGVVNPGGELVGGGNLSGGFKTYADLARIAAKAEEDKGKGGNGGRNNEALDQGFR